MTHEKPSAWISENAVCTFCGCLCDDIPITLEQGRITKVKRCCANGRGIFLDYDPAPQNPKIDGNTVTWNEAISKAVDLLNASDSPLIYGLSSAATAGQRAAISLADKLGAVIDTDGSPAKGALHRAMQSVGMATATLGEIQSRSDLVICWGCNPAETHRRLFDRYAAPMAQSDLFPNGPQNRTLIVVDHHPTQTSDMADRFYQVSPGCDAELLMGLRAIAEGKKLPVDSIGGVGVEDIKKWVDRMKACRYGAIFMGPDFAVQGTVERGVIELFSLVDLLNRHTRFAVLPMPSIGNETGADQVLTWQTGYPFAVSFATGHPVYGPGEFTAVDLLRKKEVDTALIIASNPSANLFSDAVSHLQEIPTIVMDSKENLWTKNATVYLPTARYGIDAAGTYYRMDNVPIRVPKLIDSGRPTDDEILEKIREKIQ